jgi:hypothetical protein
MKQFCPENMEKYYRRETVIPCDRFRQTGASAIWLNIGRQKKTILQYSSPSKKKYKKWDSIALAKLYKWKKNWRGVIFCI